MLKTSVISMKHRNLMPIVTLIVLTAILYAVPAFINEYPKGSDSWYHMLISRQISEGRGFSSASLDAGGHINSYPPLFHILISPIHSIPWLFVYLGPIFGMLSAIAFYFYARRFLDEKTALASGMVFASTVSMVDAFIFSVSPANLSILLIVLSLYFIDAYSGNSRRLVPAVVFPLILSLTHAMSFIVLLFFSAVIYRQKCIKPLTVPVAAFLVMASFLAANANIQILISPGIDILLYRIGIPALATALAGAYICIKAKKNAFPITAAILIIWSLASPIYPERAIIYAAIPLAMLCGYALAGKDKITVFALVLLIISSGFLFSGIARSEMTDDDARALEWIRNNTPENSTIMSTWQVSGPWIPYVAERKNVLGAFHESVPDWRERKENIHGFFSGTAQAEYNATYAFINRLEERVLYPGSIERLETMYQYRKFGDAYVFEIQ